MRGMPRAASDETLSTHPLRRARMNGRHMLCARDRDTFQDSPSWQEYFEHNKP